MKRLLVFAYDFPPSLVGVRRTVKFIRYLHDHGWECGVVTVRPVCGAGHDPTPLEELRASHPQVWRTESLDPYRLCARARGRDAAPSPRTANGAPAAGISSRTGGFRAAVMKLARRAIFVPDDRIGWVPFAIARGKRAVREWRPDALYSTSFPHSAHLAAGRVARATGVPWLADFRDGWTQMMGAPHYLTPLHRAVQERLERWVAQSADAIVTCSPPIHRHLQALRGPSGRAVVTIHNGFDDGDFPAAAPEDSTADARAGSPAAPGAGRRPFTILYTGTFFGGRRPDTFLRAVASVAERRPEFRAEARVQLLSALDGPARELLARLGIAALTELVGFRPYEESLRRQRAADLLVLVIDEGPGSDLMVTQKVFEYLAAGRPIWAFAGEGACRDLLTTTGGALLSEPRDVPGAAAALERAYEAWRAGSPLPGAAPEMIARFHRRNQAAALAEILNDMVETNPAGRR